MSELRAAAVFPVVLGLCVVSVVSRDVYGFTVVASVSGSEGSVRCSVVSISLCTWACVVYL